MLYTASEICHLNRIHAARCGYFTILKADMKKHLYLKKKPCPAQEALIELTDDIKQQIMDNRVYIPPPPPPPAAAPSINNTTINAYFANMDVFEKIKRYTDHTNKQITCFEQSIEDRYANIVTKLDNDSYHSYELKIENLYEAIDEISNVCRCKNLHDLNIYYDNDVDKMHIYEEEWEEMLMIIGTKRVVETIKTYHWDMYECYLLRKIYGSGDWRHKQHCNELLEEYFQFIGCFNLPPFCKDKEDVEILKDGVGGKGSFDISERYYAKYIKVRDALTNSTINSIKKNVADIIKKNSKRNAKQLNDTIMGLFKMDEVFKEMFKLSLGENISCFP